MKKIKALLSILLMISIVLGGSGCMNIHSTNGQIKMTEKMLNEKYGQSFCVESVGARFGTLTNNTYTAICYPNDNPQNVFIAEIDKNGTYIYDDYVSVCVCSRFEQIIQDKLSSDVALLVVSRPSETNEIERNISIDEFAQKYSADFVVYAVSKESFSDIRNSFDSVFNEFSSLDIELRCYDNVTEDQFFKFKDLSVATNQMNGAIKQLFDNLPNIVKYEKGIIGG